MLEPFYRGHRLRRDPRRSRRAPKVVTASRSRTWPHSEPRGRRFCAQGRYRPRVLLGGLPGERTGVGGSVLTGWQARCPRAPYSQHTLCQLVLWYRKYRCRMGRLEKSRRTPSSHPLDPHPDAAPSLAVASTRSSACSAPPAARVLL